MSIPPPIAWGGAFAAVFYGLFRRQQQGNTQPSSSTPPRKRRRSQLRAGGGGGTVTGTVTPPWKRKRSRRVQRAGAGSSAQNPADITNYVRVSEIGDPRQSDPLGRGLIARRDLTENLYLVDEGARYVPGRPRSALAATQHGAYIVHGTGGDRGHFDLGHLGEDGAPLETATSTIFYLNEARGGKEANVAWLAYRPPTGGTPTCLVLKVLRPIGKGEELIACYDDGSYSGPGADSADGSKMKRARAWAKYFNPDDGDDPLNGRWYAAFVVAIDWQACKVEVKYCSDFTKQWIPFKDGSTGRTANKLILARGLDESSPPAGA